ncbi:hypothetical protein MOV08_23000 [Streptomyces yunnanensis]|uniref:Uncharacterized protein n=1 Tax=Streptomyces yunnanensis TaxID=156453 RepID=A0ABY8AA13_9ACTN|nr:hypothetical protein [Streptomyces yunnanensis]WEB41845.1 hypothetical protein MOV08_23000 [Streptomyces yunnanensis]
MRGIIGFIVMLQGGLGFVGQVFFDGAWGVIRHFVHLPSPAYAGICAAGVALIAWGEWDRKRKAEGEGERRVA